MTSTPEFPKAPYCPGSPWNAGVRAALSKPHRHKTRFRWNRPIPDIPNVPILESALGILIR